MENNQAISFGENTYHGYKIFTPEATILLKTQFVPITLTKDYVIAKIDGDELKKDLNLPSNFNHESLKRRCFLRKKKLEKYSTITPTQRRENWHWSWLELW